jgi:hypothetical protein
VSTTRRAAAVTAVAAIAWAGLAVGFAGPAAATINPPNTIGCAGHAVITKANGTTLTVDATQAKVHVPRSSPKPVVYSGSVTTITHNQHGFVAVVLGPFKIHFYSWAGKNASNKSSDSGTRKYPAILKNVPPGEYHVSGGHFAAEGSCTGSLTIIVDGSPLSNPAGIVALVGSILFLALIALALRGHPVLGVIGGLLFGVFLVADLMLWSISYPTSILLFGLPIAGVVVGLALGLWGPLRPGSAAGP